MAERLLIGTRKGLFAVERRAKEWRISGAYLLGDPVTIVLPSADGSVLAAQDLGHFGVKLKRSLDGGATWEDRPVPRYPPKPEGEEDIDPARRTPVPWDLKRVWALEESANGRELWCGTIPGGLFHSSDGGEEWRFVESLWNHPDRKAWFGGGADFPGIHSILLDPRDPNVVRIGFDILNDGLPGEHSYDVVYRHALDIDTAGDTLAFGSTTGNLWLSENQGDSWQQLSAYLPPINCVRFAA
jgi:hypothetical protein